MSLSYPLSVYVKSCFGCPFFHDNEYCGLGAGNVRNHRSARTTPDNCPLVKYSSVQVWLSEDDD